MRVASKKNVLSVNIKDFIIKNFNSICDFYKHTARINQIVSYSTFLKIINKKTMPSDTIAKTEAIFNSLIAGGEESIEEECLVILAEVNTCLTKLASLLNRLDKKNINSESAIF